MASRWKQEAQRRIEQKADEFTAEITMRDNQTGAVVTQARTEWRDTWAYNWQGGNWSCDCNRASFFGDDEDAPCGEARYSLLKITNTATGEVLWEGDDRTTPPAQ